VISLVNDRPADYAVWMLHGIRFISMVAVSFASLASTFVLASGPAERPALAAAQTAILPLDQVRIGMKGYGLSVFHGTKIEPFAVEVISVMHNFAPKRGLIWVRCPDPRMQKLGPVQGMSGSPIYLWTDGPAPGQEHELGKGGLLIGALALGFSGTKDCYVGIRPIEQMRQVAGRAVADRTPDQSSSQSRGRADFVRRHLQSLIQEQATHGNNVWRAQALLRLMRGHVKDTAMRRSTAGVGMGRFPAPTPPRLNGSAQPMMLPMAVGSHEIASMLTPVLTPLGLMPVASVMPLQGAMTAAGNLSQTGHAVGIAPPGIDLEAIRLEPGSVLSIPLAFGDMDLSAIGTVTEVLPDGRVLAFGHGMFSQGPIAVPMATGFVHFVMPSLVASSFKLGGSGVIQGAIVQDENSAIVGMPAGQFTTAPVDVTINVAGQTHRQYHYEVVHHKQLTPFIVTSVVLQSMTSISNLPAENTLRLRGELRFTGGRTLQMNTVIADAAAKNILMELLPVVSVMMQNPHESMMLESLSVTADVEPTPRIGSLVDAQVDRVEIDPGDTIGITLYIQPYGQPAAKHHVKLKIPDSLSAGDYDLIICDSKSYMPLLFESRPHLLFTTDADDLQAVVQRILNIKNDALYVVWQLKEPGLAIGGQELPQLPSSKRAMFDTPANTMASPYVEWIEKTVPLGMVTQGNVKFTITVREEPTP